MFDGFCNDLLHEHPVEARVDPQFEVLGEAEAEGLYGEAFDGCLGTGAPDGEVGHQSANGFRLLTQASQATARQAAVRQANAHARVAAAGRPVPRLGRGA